MRRRKKRTKSDDITIEISKKYTIEELIELGEKNNRIELAKPLYGKKNVEGQKP